MEITRHFTATTVIVHEGKTLLHLHKKLGFWLPVGGHIDRDELPQEAALREIEEECGLKLELHCAEEPKQYKDAQTLIPPQHLLLEDINPFHQHIDFIFFAESTTAEIVPEDGEPENMRWFTASELQDLDAPDNVKALCLEAIELFT